MRDLLVTNESVEHGTVSCSDIMNTLIKKIAKMPLNKKGAAAKDKKAALPPRKPRVRRLKKNLSILCLRMLHRKGFLMWMIVTLMSPREVCI